MPRFFVSDPIDAREEITIRGQEARHIDRVLRLRAGDRVDIFDGTGKEYQGKITRQGSQAVTVRILETTVPDRESPLTVIMGQSLIKGNKMDFIIQKATEMGVSEFVPFVSVRSITRLDGSKSDHRVDRWRKITVAASKQCGRVIPMRVESVLGFDETLRRSSAGTQRIILWERGEGKLKAFLRKKDQQSAGFPGVYFLVGPEGGFSDEEVRQAEAAHFVPVGLGSRLLRAETAGLTFIGIVQYEWGDLG
jgi:16S rRNA (uracil1498-N3)-methyltransferase